MDLQVLLLRLNISPDKVWRSYRSNLQADRLNAKRAVPRRLPVSAFRETVCNVACLSEYAVDADTGWDPSHPGGGEGDGCVYRFARQQDPFSIWFGFSTKRIRAPSIKPHHRCTGGTLDSFDVWLCVDQFCVCPRSQLLMNHNSCCWLHLCTLCVCRSWFNWDWNTISRDCSNVF